MSAFFIVTKQTNEQTLDLCGAGFSLGVISSLVDGFGEMDLLVSSKGL